MCVGVCVCVHVCGCVWVGVGVWVWVWVHMDVWVHIEWIHKVCTEKCIGRFSTKLQLLSLQLVPCTGMGTIACTPVLLMRSCGPRSTPHSPVPARRHRRRQLQQEPTSWLLIKLHVLVDSEDLKHILLVSLDQPLLCVCELLLL